MRARTAFISGLAVAGVLAFGATSAQAAVNIGQTAFPTFDTDPNPNINPFNCLKDTAPMLDTSTMIQWQRQAGSLPSYTVPAGGGVVTSWAYHGPDITFPETMALKMLRPAGGTNFTVIGTSDVESPLPGPNPFSTKIPVKEGDVLGLYIQHNGNTAYCQEAAPNPPFNDGDKTREADGTQNVANGGTVSFGPLSATITEQSARLDVAAVVEPDVDGDGLGDETQDDSLPPNPKADNTPPDTTVTGKRKFKPKKGKKTASAKFTFSSDDSGATFQCRLDAKAFADCTSPKTVKAKAGTHVFTVVASDAHSNADPTAAAKLFTVASSK